MSDEESEGESEGGRAGGASAKALTPPDRLMTGLRFSIGGTTPATASFPTAELADRFRLATKICGVDWVDTAKDMGGAALVLVRRFPHNVSVWLNVELGRFLVFDGQDFVPPSHPLYSDAEKAVLILIGSSEEPSAPSPNGNAGNGAPGAAGHRG
jgi:hypothetical protein